MRRSRFAADDYEEEEEDANWQDSYSDLVTDLLAIFVILFAFAMMNQAHVNYNAAHGDDILGIGMPSGDAILVASGGLLSNGAGTGEKSEFDVLYETIRVYVADSDFSEFVSVQNLGDERILLRVSASVFFDSSQAVVHAEADELLTNVASILTDHKDNIAMVRIEGHTDNLPIHTAQFPSNWELSTSRAVNVLRRLIDLSDLDARQFSAVGYGENYPIADNGVFEGRVQNRRVDFLIEGIREAEN